MADRRRATPTDRRPKAGRARGVDAMQLIFASLALATAALAAAFLLEDAVDRRSLILLAGATVAAAAFALASRIFRPRARPILILGGLAYCAMMVGVVAFQFNVDGETYVRAGVSGLLVAGVVAVLACCLLPWRRGGRRHHELFNYFDN